MKGRDKMPNMYKNPSTERKDVFIPTVVMLKVNALVLPPAKVDSTLGVQ